MSGNLVAKHIGYIQKQLIAIWATVSGGSVGVQQGFGAKNQRAENAQVGSADNKKGCGAGMNMIRVASQVGLVG